MSKQYISFFVALFASVVRHYDYALLGLSAGAISKSLMPYEDDESKMMAFFAVFAISVIARPFGSIIFGKIADKINRVAAIKLSIILAAISTSFVALIPDFNIIGYGSVILLIVCRMIFFISLSGEVDAIRIYISEQVGIKNRYFANGVVSSVSQIGSLLAAFMYFVSTSVEDLDWLWRLNFLLGGVLGLIVFQFRNYLYEKDIIKKPNISDASYQDSYINLIKIHKIRFTVSIMIHGILGGVYNFIIVFFGSFTAKIFGITSLQEASSINVGLIFMYGFGAVISGYIADKVNPFKQIIVALILSCVFAIMIFISIEFDNFPKVFFKYIHFIFAFIPPFFTIPCGIKMQSLFASKVRMRMFSLSHSTGSMLISSTTPFISWLIWNNTHSLLSVIFYFILQIFVLFLCVFYLHKKDYKNMFES